MPRWQITELALFGSVLRPDFRADSDVDLLVSFAPDAHWSLFDHVDMQDELQAILGRQVDLLTRAGIERSQNYLRRRVRSLPSISTLAILRKGETP